MTGRSEAQAPRMSWARPARTCVVVALLVLAKPSGAHAWRSLSAEEPNFVGWRAPSVSFSMDLLPDELAHVDVVSEVVAAVRVWSDSVCAAPAPAFLGYRHAPIGSASGPTVYIRWVDEQWWGDPSEVALTTLDLYQTPSETWVGGAEIAINLQYFSFSGPTRLDLRRIFAHEFGHVFGLLHTDENEASAAGSNLMDTYYYASSEILRPSADDLDGACFLYGIRTDVQPPIDPFQIEPQGTAMPGDPCVESSECAVGECDVYCTTDSTLSGFGESCSDGNACESGFCLLGPNTCTRSCETTCGEFGTCKPVDNVRVCVGPSGCAVAGAAASSLPPMWVVLTLLSVMFRRRRERQP